MWTLCEYVTQATGHRGRAAAFSPPTAAATAAAVAPNAHCLGRQGSFAPASASTKVEAAASVVPRGDDVEAEGRHTVPAVAVGADRRQS
jgi:hypothetical protein